MLRIPVKINGVNNLSDARYCAGMGVDMIGFSVSENQARYLPPDQINGITGWLSGVQIVTEAYFGEKPAVLLSKAESIHSSLLEVDASMYKGVAFPSFQMVYRLNLREWSNLQEVLPEDSFLHIVLEKNDITNTPLIQEICARRKTFLNGSLLDLPVLEQILLEAKPYGITLDGGNELSPGVIDFEHLAEVLEYLEV